MKHTVTLDEADIKRSVTAFIEENFPGYTAAQMRIRHNAGNGPMERSSTQIDVDLCQPPETKD